MRRMSTRKLSLFRLPPRPEYSPQSFWRLTTTETFIPGLSPFINVSTANRLPAFPLRQIPCKYIGQSVRSYGSFTTDVLP